MSDKLRTPGIDGDIDKLEQHYMVGREREIRLFRERLTGAPQRERILNVYGTGGVGKSYLLEQFRRLCGETNTRFLMLDSSLYCRTPADLCLNVLRLLRDSSHSWNERQCTLQSLKQECLDELGKAAGGRTVVLALDTFEEIGETERWLRDEFLASMSPNVLTIIAGRFPLQGAWLSSPAWRQFILRMPLAEFDYETAKQYLTLSGVHQEKTLHTIWTKTHGHPLTLSLYAATTLAGAMPQMGRKEDGEIFPYVVKVWLKEVPDPADRELVEAAAVLRHFNQELLSYILEKQVTTEQFLRLSGYSFVRRDERGWIVHDMLRDAIRHELQMRAPAYYDKLWKRCIHYYYARIKQSSPHRPARAAGWESADWVYYISDYFIQALFYRHNVTYRLEPLHRSNWGEAEQYVAHRRHNAQDVRIQHTDPATNKREQFLIGAAESVSGYAHASLRELYELDPSTVKLIRDELGDVCGMACMIPIHERTLHYLLTKPPSSTYFSSLPESKLKELRKPADEHAGYFIAFIDVRDYADAAMRQAAGFAFFSHMLAARLVVTTSPAVPFFHTIFQKLGFVKTKDVVHYDYGEQPAPYFVLDTRGSRLYEYLDRMIASFGSEHDGGNRGERHWAALSKREQSVAGLLLKGFTNAEIAEALFVSEATVKRHVSSIFRKLQVRNRAQLIHQYKGQ